MRKKATLIALLCILITGCTVRKQCDAYSHQCDEMYPYYDCDHPEMYSYTPRNYRKHIKQNSYTQGYGAYYPNTQTIYYVPYNVDFYGNKLQPNEYRSRDINGRPAVGDVTRPQAPPVNKPRPSIKKD